MSTYVLKTSRGTIRVNTREIVVTLPEVARPIVRWSAVCNQPRFGGGGDTDIAAARKLYDAILNKYDLEEPSV